MTKAQTGKYWRLFRDVCDSAVALNGAMTASERDALRYSLHRTALGYNCSMTELDNEELDFVFAVFQDVADGGDGTAAAPTTEALEKRRELLVTRSERAVNEFGDGRPCGGYLATISANVGGELRWPPRNSETLRKVMGIVEKRARWMRAKQRKTQG